MWGRLTRGAILKAHGASLLVQLLPCPVMIQPFSHQWNGDTKLSSPEKRVGWLPAGAVVWSAGGQDLMEKTEGLSTIGRWYLQVKKGTKEQGLVFPPPRKHIRSKTCTQTQGKLLPVQPPCTARLQTQKILPDPWPQYPNPPDRRRGGSRNCFHGCAGVPWFADFSDRHTHTSQTGRYSHQNNCAEQGRICPPPPLPTPHAL